MPRSKNRTVTAPLWKYYFKTHLKRPYPLVLHIYIDAEMRKRKGEKKNREKGTNSEAVCGILRLWKLHSSTEKGQIAPDVIPSRRRDRGVASVIR